MDENYILPHMAVSGIYIMCAVHLYTGEYTEDFMDSEMVVIDENNGYRF